MAKQKILCSVQDLFMLKKFKSYAALYTKNIFYEREKNKNVNNFDK